MDGRKQFVSCQVDGCIIGGVATYGETSGKTEINAYGIDRHRQCVRFSASSMSRDMHEGGGSV